MGRSLRPSLILVLPVAMRVAAGCSSADSETAIPGTQSDAGAVADSSPQADDSAAASDTATTQESGFDAGPACDPTKPFDAPVNVTSINSPQDDSHVTLTADEKTLYVSTSRAGTFDIYVATRPDATSAFGTPQPENVLSDPSLDERGPTISSDGSRLFFTSKGPSNSYPYLWTTERQGSSFAPPIQVAYGGQYDPYLQADGGHLYYIQELENAFVMEDSTVSGGTITKTVTVVQSTKNATPVISADGLTFYYATNVATANAPIYDIWRATRAPGGAFGTSEPVTELNTASNDYPAWISPDGCTMYLTSDRPNGVGGLDIWMARRPK